jgi:hypothetical protein
MKKITVLLCGLFLCQSAFGWEFSKKAEIPVPVINTSGFSYRMVTTVTTNTDVDESNYKAQTNGHKWAENHAGNWNINPQWYSGYMTNIVSTVSFGTNLVCLYFSENQGQFRVPDPFEEKVTVTRYTMMSNETFYWQMGPLEMKAATIHTIFKRWQTIHRQKLSQHESTETVEQ